MAAFNPSVGIDLGPRLPPAKYRLEFDISKPGEHPAVASRRTAHDTHPSSFAGGGAFRQASPSCHHPLAPFTRSPEAGDPTLDAPDAPMLRRRILKDTTRPDGALDSSLERIIYDLSDLPRHTLPRQLLPSARPAIAAVVRAVLRRARIPRRKGHFWLASAARSASNSERAEEHAHEAQEFRPPELVVADVAWGVVAGTARPSRCPARRDRGPCPFSAARLNCPSAPAHPNTTSNLALPAKFAGEPDQGRQRLPWNGRSSS
jgi:hypothetical protein